MAVGVPAARQGSGPRGGARRDPSRLIALVLLAGAIAVVAVSGGAERFRSLAQLANGPAQGAVEPVAAQLESEAAAMASWLAGSPLRGERATIVASRSAPAGVPGGVAGEPTGQSSDGASQLAAASPGGTPGVISTPEAGGEQGGGGNDGGGGSGGGGSGPVQQLLGETGGRVGDTVDRTADAVGRTGRDVLDRAGSSVEDLGGRVRRGVRDGTGLDLP